MFANLFAATLLLMPVASIASSPNTPSSRTLAGPKILQRYHVKVEGRAFKVVTYIDGSVKVILGGMVGPSQSVQLRDRMRRAVVTATGCSMADDFFLDGKLAGTLRCEAGSAKVPA